MSFIDLTARLLARKQGKALPIRSTYGLAPDPSLTFAIAPIKMVSEEIVQAVAFGSPSQAPSVIARWNPLSRDASDLEPLAAGLTAYLERCTADGALPRVWLPHSSALVLVELLGHRYRTNERASSSLRRMGELCRALAEEARFEGQQVVAVAADLLRRHVVTGQAPIKDGHLGALLAWVDPVPGVDPSDEADRRALKPASGVLERRFDDAVEAARIVAKNPRRRDAARARTSVQSMLISGAIAEWDLLVRARAAFWSLGLRQGPEVDRLVAQSARRIHFAVGTPLSPAKHPHALIRELSSHEYAAELAEAVSFLDDERVRERARSKGRALRLEVVTVNQPKANRKPCWVEARSLQEVMRVRIGTKLQRQDGLVTGRIDQISETPSGDSLLRIEVETGVQRSRIPRVGDVTDWVDAVPADMSIPRGKVLEAMQKAGSHLVYGTGLRAGPPLPKRPVDLLAVARGLKKP